MIVCTPKSIWSWNFNASGLASGNATVETYWLTEQGKIIYADVVYEIRKHGVFSGHWTMDRGGRVISEARKTSAMFRSFQISGDGIGFSLQAASPFTRVFEIGNGEQIVGRIQPAHAFTRRSFIECTDSIPELVQLFAFWLVVLTWKRSANKNSAAS